MGFGLLGSVLALTLFIRPLVCQQPNTDGFFLSEFLQKMGFNFPQISDPFCDWPGVFCDDRGENVVKFVASGLGLSGVIPDTTIGKLIKLNSLDLSNNKIIGLPTDFWSLGSLKNLNLSFNGLSENLSSNIGNFGQLESLDISFNNFSGSLPESISSLESLKVLKLDQNGFVSEIPRGILKCNSLVTIDLSGNKLNGSLPDGFGSAFPKLIYLNLAENDISGKDSDFSGLTSISYLNISGNSFKGSLIGLFQGPLEVIDVSRNQFEGHISQVNFSPGFDLSRLIYMDLSENHLSGDLIAGLNDASNLKHLNLAYNRFSQQELLHLHMLSGLDYLNFSDTNLIGQIPVDISLLGGLKTLDLSNNHLNGSFPSLIMDNLQVLDVSYNNFSGNIPVNVLRKLHGMERFNFSYNNLTYCGSEISSEVVSSAFIGSVDSCPIAANPDFFKRKTRKNDGLKLALALTISMVCLLIGLLFFAFGCRRTTRMWETKQASYNEEEAVSGPFSFQADSTVWVADVKQATSVPVVIFEKPLLNFTFADLLTATSQFDRGTLLAEGRYGPVYRGFLPGGFHVAVKVLVHGSTMTDQEAAKELEYLGRIKHPNLVPLTGYCLAGEQRICIYDYMENGNLQNLLYDLPLGVQATDDWNTDTWEEDDNNNSIRNLGPEGLLTNWRFRHKIALGTARALAFLHHGCFPAIIHRDVKASSVYLDHNFEPRLSDFGLAKIFGNALEDEIACGPPGYAPPEFLDQQIVSPKTATSKSDVYGFGVILFELITGKKPVDDDYPEPEEKDLTLVSWVRGLVRKNQSSRAIDQKIRGSGEESQMVEALKIGYLCTADHPSKRPSMQQVVGLIKDIEPAT